MFDDDYTFIGFDSEEIVRSFNKDPTKLFPVRNSIAKITFSNLPDQMSIDGKWIFDGNEIIYNNSYIKNKMNA